MSDRLLPYDTIVKAHEGDPEAIQAVLDRYAGYIRYFSKMNGYYNSDMEDYIRTKLIESLFKFRFDRWVWIDDMIKSFYQIRSWGKERMEDKKILLDNIDKIHTTEMGIDRIKRNLKIDTADVVEYCKNKVLDKNCNIYKQGKNWYCEVENIKITINSYSYTIITAHIVK